MSATITMNAAASMSDIEPARLSVFYTRDSEKNPYDIEIARLKGLGV
jgi:hypothetical protein